LQYDSPRETRANQVQDDQLEALQRGPEVARCSQDLAGPRPEVVWACQWQARPPVNVFGRCNPVLLDHQGLVRHGVALSDGNGRKPAQARWPVMVGARLRHGLPTSEDNQSPNSVSANSAGAAPAHRQHGPQDDGRRRIEAQKARRGVPAPVAQAAHRHRRTVAGDQGHRGHAQLVGRCAGAAQPARAATSARDAVVGQRRRCLWHQGMPHDAIVLRQARAIIPVRKSPSKPWKENRPGSHTRNEILCATQRLGRDIWKRSSGYHRRSLVETKMQCVELMGERIMARDSDRQVAELQVRAAILNRSAQLDTP
jgi:hypothetical protein